MSGEEGGEGEATSFVSLLWAAKEGGHTGISTEICKQ